MHSLNLMRIAICRLFKAAQLGPIAFGQRQIDQTQTTRYPRIRAAISRGLATFFLAGWAGEGTHHATDAHIQHLHVEP